MGEYLSYFFNPAHLWTLRATPMSDRAITILAIFFAALIVISIVTKFLKPIDGLAKQGHVRLFHAFLTIGILGYVYIFFAWQGAFLLGARWWLLVLLIILITWLFFIIKYMKVTVPAKRVNNQRKKEIQKYIP